VKHIALLRAVNLAGHNKVGMVDLRNLLTGLGFDDAQTLLQSGNVVFSGGRKAAPSLEQTLERAAATQLGLETEFFVRTAQEWQALIDANPFPSQAKDDPSHLVAVILKADVSAADVGALQQAIVGREVVRAKGRCAYIVIPMASAVRS
jgi:uncharacterized protein (DUF1697 family)